jgi:WD40 repeat protein
MIYTPNGRLISGGADSNIKIYSYYNKDTVAPEYFFIKHCDEIDNIEVIKSEEEQDETIVSGDKTGAIFVWIVGSGRAIRMVNLGENAIWGCYGLHITKSDNKGSVATANSIPKLGNSVIDEDIFKVTEKCEGGIIGV